MSGSPAIALEGVSKVYGEAAAVAALHNVSLTVPNGQFLAILGPSGSGKTTLLRLINRLAEPTSGTVRVGDEDIRTLDPVLLRRRIGYVFQGVGLFPHLTVAENIAITPKLMDWDPARIAARVNELLGLVRLEPAIYRDRSPAQISGGERQRVGVARALAAEPRLVLMDEPFGALDPLTRDALSHDYRTIHDTIGLTTVMITHDATEAVLLADRIVVVHAGRIIADGTPHRLMTSDVDPYARELMDTPRRQADRLRALMAGGGA